VSKNKTKRKENRKNTKNAFPLPCTAMKLSTNSLHVYFRHPSNLISPLAFLIKLTFLDEELIPNKNAINIYK
jgi:hypothetical protein